VRAIGSDARASITSLVAQLDVPAAVNVEVVLAQEPAVPFLRRLSTTSALIVVGRHQHWAQRLLDGDVSSALASSSHCPIVTVPTGWTSRPMGSVIVCLDGDTSAAGALEFAFAEVDGSRRDLVIFHAVDVKPGPDTVETERRHIAEIAAGWQEQYPSVSVRYDLGIYDAGKAIALAARGASMAVVGSPHAHRVTWSWLYSLARSVVNQIDCPLAVAPSAASTPIQHTRIARASSEFAPVPR